MSHATSTRQPSYRKHKATGQAVVTLNGKDIYLGRFKSKESRAEYDRQIARWLANGRRLPATDWIMVVELTDRFWAHVEQHYRKPDGTPTSEIDNFRCALRPLRHLFGTTSAKDFGPLSLKAVRVLMENGYEHPRHGYQPALTRGSINRHVGRIKRMFRWATENEIVPPSVYHGLLAVRGLQRGRCAAKEAEPVRPAPEALIDAVRPHVSRPVAALIDLQLLTAARPGELCIMRGCDLNMAGRIWTYTPATHKNDYRGHKREIYLGPKAQEIVKRFLKMDLSAYLFSPKDTEIERHAERRQGRRTPLYPSHVRHLEEKRKGRRNRAPREHYDANSYAGAIAYACIKAFPLPAHLGPRIKPDGKRETRKEWTARLTPEEKQAVQVWRREHSWHPHQLRHNAATNLRREFGVELARIILGHKTAFTTEIYAEADKQQAMEVIGKVG
jgi:integrase